MSTPKFDSRAFLLGVIASIIPAVGAAWAFATTAAEHILQPHLQGAKVRVHLMCRVAELQNRNIKAICDKVGADCNTSGDDILIAECREADK